MKKFISFIDRPICLIIIGLILLLLIVFIAGKSEMLNANLDGPSIFYGISLCWSGELLGAGICGFFDSKSSAPADDDKNPNK